MFPILKASFAAILSGVLASFLEVDDNDIQTKLLGNDGKVSLKNVKVRERKIKLSHHGDNVICYLVIAGGGASTIRQLDLQWKWASGNGVSWKVAKGMILENSVLFIKGVNLKVSFRFEKIESGDEFTEQSQKGDRVTRNNSLYENNIKEQKKSLSSLFNEEWGRLRRAAVGNLQETELAHQLTQNILNSFTLKMEDIKIKLVVPFTGTFLELGLKSGKFGNMDQDDQGVAIQSGPLMLEIILEKVYADLHSGDPNASKKKTLFHPRRSTWKSVVPILEPLSYRATIRRAAGTRFTTWLNGFEVVGREHSVINRFSLQQETGITFHHSEEAKRAFEQILSAYRGQGQEIDYDSEIYNMHNEEPPMEKWPVSAKYILVLLSWIFIAVGLVAVSLSFRIMGIFQNSKLATIGLWATGVVQSVRVAILIVAKINYENGEGKLLRQSRKRHREKKVHDYPAIFRLPFPYITVVGSNKLQLTITKISVMGRVDCSKIHVSAAGLNVTSNTDRLRGPNISMAGIRATRVDRTTLVNIDRIDSIFVPGRFLAEKPVLGTVISFDDGRMEIKLRSVRGRLLKANEDVPEADNSVKERDLPDFKKVAATVNKTSKMVHEEIQKGLEMLNRHENRVKIAPVTDKDEIDSRNRMGAEVYESLFKLQILARMFEQIPVQRNRENLRLYPRSFRGTEAVSFVLENNMAGTRHEAVKLLKDIEVQFDLFESVSREYRFRDDYHALFRFKDPSKRRCWNRDDLPYDYIEGFDRTPQSSPIPFPISILVNRVSLSRYDAEEDERLVIATNGEVYLEQGKLARVVDATVCLGELKTDMIAASNARVRGMMDPVYPKLIHRLQVSCDSAQVNPSLTTDDWFSFLGFDMSEEDDDASASHRSSSMSQKSEGQVAEPFLLPFMVVPEFLLQLSWRGVMIKANQSSIKVQSFYGSETTNSDDLVKLFVIKILGQTPGVLANVNFMGVNLMQSAGIATAIEIGAKIVPGGTYVGMLALVTYDSVCTALDAGKAARHDPTGKYKPGDLFRGLWSSGGEISRQGAKLRGKTDEEYYDEEDRIQLDPIDFVVGAGHNTSTYANENKARFAGAYTATAVMIATTVFFGPIGGIAAGVVAGAATEAGVNFVEDRMFRKAQPKEEAMDDDRDDDDNADS